jgi:hypothetical protein
MKHNVRYGGASLLQIDALYEAHGGEEGVRFFLAKRWSLFMRITSDAGVKAVDGADFLRNLEIAHVNIAHKGVVEIVGKLNFSLSGWSPSDIILTSTNELTDDRGDRPAGREEIFSRAFSLGLELMPHYDILPLILEFISRPPVYGSMYYIGMKPVVCANGLEQVLVIGYDEGGGRLQIGDSTGLTSSGFMYPNCNNWFFRRFDTPEESEEETSVPLSDLVAKK